MTKNIYQVFAFEIGAQFAEQVLGSANRDSWSLFDDTAEIPDADYGSLCALCGDEPERAVIREYKNGFNSVFMGSL